MLRLSFYYLTTLLQQTALHWSAYYNNPEHAKLLIKHDSNIGIPDMEGKIPLHWAANHKDPSAVHTVRCILVGRMLCYTLKPFLGKTNLIGTKALM